MHFLAALCTDLCFAATALAVLAVAVAADAVWPNPLAALSGRAVQAVARSILLVLVVPILLERSIEQSINILERNVIDAAASRGHVLRICHRHAEDSAKARVTHAMTALQIGSFRQ